MVSRAESICACRRAAASAGNASTGFGYSESPTVTYAPLVGEEWISGPYCTLTALLALLLKRYGVPVLEDAAESLGAPI